MDSKSGLVHANQEYEGTHQQQIFNKIKEKTGIDAVFFLKSPSGDTDIPTIFFSAIDSYNEEKISELHRLSWNLGEAPLLFIVMPDQLLILNNYEKPSMDGNDLSLKDVIIEKISLLTNLEEERQKILQYDRINFETGKYWKQNNGRFKFENKIDSVLINNLLFMRDKFKESIDDVSVIHSLLGRSILIKYLEDRIDKDGNGAFPKDFFKSYLPDAEVFSDVLSSKEATYNLFNFFQDKFHGDMFPLTDNEVSKVSEDDLLLLQDFLTGNIDFDIKQYNLWPLYSFNHIPIQLISTIYEMFFQLEIDEKQKNNRRNKKISRNGTYYTPYYLVELLMDEILPWDGLYSKDFRIIDPSCGSGIFLVEAYRRVISRWMVSNKRTHISPDELKVLMKKHIYGVDINLEAVRIASFSLCLVLCDYLEPLSIWEELIFPNMIGSNLFNSDFFCNDQEFNSMKFDVVIGNPPWESHLSKPAQKYLINTKSKIGDKQISQLFSWKCSNLLKENGDVCLLMPSKGFLFNRSTKNLEYRREFFEKQNVTTVINFTNFRNILFENAKSPATAVFYNNKKRNDTSHVIYCTPKPSFTIEDRRMFVIEPLDIIKIPRDIVGNEYIWKIGMFGGPRDLNLIERISDENSKLLDVINEFRMSAAEGYKKGNASKFFPDFFGLPLVKPRDIQALSIDIDSLEINTETNFERVSQKNLNIFSAPHLLIKQSPKDGRIISAVLHYDAIFGHSFLGIHGREDILKYISIFLISSFTTYYQLMTSRRWIIERSELEAEEIRNTPIPVPNESDLEEAKKIFDLLVNTNNEDLRVVDQYVYKKLNLKKYDQHLIEDINRKVYAMRTSKSQIEISQKVDKNILLDYSQVLGSVLESTFGQAIFYTKSFVGNAPLVVVKIEINGSDKENEIFVDNDSDLLDTLYKLDKLLLQKQSQGLFIRRNAVIYEPHSIYIVKPNEEKYWTFSSACRDADEIYAQIMRTWRNSIEY